MGLMSGGPPVESNPDPVTLVCGRLQKNGPDGVNNVLVQGCKIVLIGGW
jgi:hypothetical protein